jgi:inosose dehydratase
MESICHQHDLQLASHPHLGSPVESQAQLERFMVGSEVGLCLDTGDLLLGGMDPADIVELTPGRVRHVHLKEVDPRLAVELRAGRLDHAEATRRGLYQPLDAGTGRAVAALEALCRRDFSGWMVIEQACRLDVSPAPGTGPVAGIRRSLDVLRDFV